MSFNAFDALLKQKPASQRLLNPVVVIDDDPAVRAGLAVLLDGLYSLTVCSGAQGGIDAVNEDVCAVILDVKMPGLDGFWACTEIRKKAPTVPVIFFSAYQDAKNPYAIINDHRPFGYVSKGGDASKLLEMLKLAVKLQSVIIANRKLIASLSKASAESEGR